jgi:peroxiredoxin
MQDMPALAALYRDYAGRGFELVAVAMPYDPPNLVLEVSRRDRLPFPIALDVDGAITRAFGDVAVTPTTVLIDAQGRIVARDTGAHDFDALRRQLDEMLDAVG